MSAPASRPVHPCVVSVTQQGSRGAEFSTWAYLTHTRGPAWQPQPSNTTTNNHNDSNDSPPAGASPLPNLVTAAGSSIHVYSHCPTTQQLKLEVSFPNIAGTICFLATLTPKRLHHDERDALLIGVAAPARLTVVTLERNEHGPLLQAVCLMDFSTVATAAAGTTTTTNTSTLEDAQYTLLDEGATGQYHHNYNNNTLTASQSISTAPSSSSSSKVKPKNYRNNRTTRPGLATVAVVLGGGSGVAVCELVCQPIQPQQHGHPIQHGWFALEPYILPLHALSRQLPHLRNSAASEQDTTNNNNAAMAGGNNPNNPNNPTANTTENNANQPMATGWGDMIHATFLSGYLEPVLLILHTAAGGRPWAGRWARENTSGPPPTFVTALSVGVAHRRAALLWSLPATVDAQTLQPLPNGTSCLVVGTNIIMSIQAGKIHQILAVNGWAHTTCPATLKPQLQPNAPMKLALQLDGCQICVLHARACLVVLRRGQVYLLQKTMTSSNSSGPCWSLFPTGQSLASTMGEVAQLQSWPFQQQQQQQQQHAALSSSSSSVIKKEEKDDNGNDTNSLSSTRTGLVFAGSRLGDSLLLSYAVDTIQLPYGEIHPMEDDNHDEGEAPSPLADELLQLKPTNGEDEEILVKEEEALYAPPPDENNNSSNNNASVNIVAPSDDDDDDENDDETWKFESSKNKRRRLTKCCVLRELTPLDRIVSLGPVGASCEGPLASTPALAAADTIIPTANTGSGSSNNSKPDVSFGSSAFIFPCGFGSSGGLALVTTPGRDDRTILAEKDCLNVQCIFSLPASELVLLGMIPTADGRGGIKLLRQTIQSDEKSSGGPSSSNEQWTEVEEWTDPRDETMNVISTSSILLNAHEMGRDGTFCLLVQDMDPHDGSLSWRIVMARWNSDLTRCDFLDDFNVNVEEPGEFLKASSPFASFAVDGDDQCGIACRWSSGRVSLVLIAKTGVKCIVNAPPSLHSDVTMSDKSATQQEGEAAIIEDEETMRIQEFYSSTDIVAADLFRAPPELLKIQETNEATAEKEEAETRVENSETVTSSLIRPDFDEDDIFLYGLAAPAQSHNEDEAPSAKRTDHSTTLSTFLALFRKSGMLELYEVNEGNGELVRCWICNGGERGQHCLQPGKTVAPLPFPRSHFVTVEEIRFFMCGPSISSDGDSETSLRSLSMALKTSNDDLFLYTVKSEGNGLSCVLERESIFSQCRKTREQTRHRTKLIKKGIIPKDAMALDSYEHNNFFRFSNLSGQDGLFAALPQPKWIVSDRGRPTVLVHRTRHSAPAGGKSSPVMGFCSSLSNGGFVTLHERVGRFGSQRLTVFKEISPIFRKPGLIPGGGLCIEKIAMGVTVRQIKFIDNPAISTGDHPLFAVIVSRELEVDQSDLNDDGMTAEEREAVEREKEEARIQRQVEADLGGFDVEQEWVEEIARDDVFQIDANLGGAPPIPKEFYSLWIVDAANEWRVVDSYDLDEYEHGLTLQVMELTDFQEEPGSAQTTIEVEDLTTTTFITLGTGTLNHNGEDVSSKGRVLLFEVKKLDAATIRRLGTHMVANLRLTYEKEIFHGPVTTLSCLSVEGKNRLVIGAGADVNMEQWGNGKLTQVGFFRATMQIQNIMIFKNFLLLSDAYDSIHFLVWRESDKSLTLLAKDYDPIVVYAAGIMSRGAAMTFLCHDDRQNLQFFQYAPGEAAARGGNKLVCRSDFHLGSQTIAFQQHYCRSSLLIHSATPTSTVAALKQQDPYHGRTEDDQRLGVHFGTTDSTIVSVVPLSEPVYWRLAALQSVLANAMEANCALSSRAWRLYRRSPRRGGCRNNDRKKGVIDGDLILRYAGLPLTDQEELASAIGSTVDLILDNLLELECGSLML